MSTIRRQAGRSPCCSAPVKHPQVSRCIFRDDYLRGPLALVFAPNGNLLTANGDAVNDDPTQPSEISPLSLLQRSDHRLLAFAVRIQLDGDITAL